MVPVVSIIMMALSVIISVGLPILLLVLWHKRTGARLLSALAGAITFVIFVYVLENALHQLCIFQDTPVSRFIQNNNWAYVLYAGFAAGIFEETGRFVTMKWIMRKQQAKREGVMYGIGHGGIEAILVAGFAGIANIVFSLQLNGTGAEALLAQAAGQETVISASIDSLLNTAPGLFLVSGVERIIAISLHIALSVLVYQAAKRKGRLWLYPVAICLHAAVDCVAGLYHIGVLSNVLWVEVIVFVMTALIALWAWRLYQNDRDPQPSVPEAAQETV